MIEGCAIWSNTTTHAKSTFDCSTKIILRKRLPNVVEFGGKSVQAICSLANQL